MGSWTFREPSKMSKLSEEVINPPRGAFLENTIRFFLLRRNVTARPTTKYVLSTLIAMRCISSKHVSTSGYAKQNASGSGADL
jgi:hypothetical protein